MRTYEYQHIVGFEETNVVGNVYYANFVRWQGRCREMFLQEHTPGVLTEISQDLSLVTLRVSCEYLGQLFAFDKIAIRMRLGTMKQNRVQMLFEYWRLKDGKEELIARGEQEIACMRRQGENLVPTPIPADLYAALQLYQES